MIKLAFIFVIIALIGFWLWNSGNIPVPTETGTTPSPSVSIRETEEQLVTIDELNMQMTIPESFFFSQERQMNLTTNEPYAVTFTAQNYENDPTQAESPFQLYGIYQWDTGPTTQEAFESSDFMFTEGSREEFSVDGKPAVRGIVSGDRGRYTVYILVNDHVLTLAADGSDETHQAITDTIVNSIRFSE